MHHPNRSHTNLNQMGHSRPLRLTLHASSSVRPRLASFGMSIWIKWNYMGELPMGNCVVLSLYFSGLVHFWL